LVAYCFRYGWFRGDTWVVIASMGDDASGGRVEASAVAGERADASEGRSIRKVQVIYHCDQAAAPLTQFTRIVPLVLQSIKTTIVNIV
jgi:hypothetical protein